MKSTSSARFTSCSLMLKMMWCTLLLLFTLTSRTVAEDATLPAPSGFIAYEQTFYDRIHLSWLPLNVTTDFFGYKLDYFPEERLLDSNHSTYRRNITNVIISKLRGHTRYVFRLQAIRENKTGTEGIPATINVITIDARPPRPVIVEVVALDTGGITVTWKAPEEQFDGVIQQYEITFRPEGEGRSDIVRTNSPTLLKKTVGGLKQKTTYFVSVKAVSGSGAGQMSKEWAVTTAEAEKDNKSLIIIMCCATIIPVVLVVIFVLLYLFVLRPALMSMRQEPEEIPDDAKCNPKLTELTAMNGNSSNPLVVNSEKPPVNE